MAAVFQARPPALSAKNVEAESRSGRRKRRRRKNNSRSRRARR